MSGGGGDASVPSARPRWEANEQLRSPTYRHPIPFFTAALNGQEIVEALECRMYGLAASETFIAVHWSLIREARDEIEYLRGELAAAIETRKVETLAPPQPNPKD